MESYEKLIRQDVLYHPSSEDASLWPLPVSHFLHSLKNQMRLPRWLETGPVLHTNERVLDLLGHLRASNEAARADLWDDVDGVVDDGIKQRLHDVFNAALVDCARIRAVLEAEEQTETSYPKESFLAVLVRNAVLNAHSGLSPLEDVPVVLPRHFSGEAIPILNYMTKYFHASLVISICEDMPIEKSDSDPGDQLSEEDSSDESELFEYSPPTMSEFLDACERPRTAEDVEEEQVESVLPPQFEAYFLGHPASAIPPSICHISILCMANKQQLPLLMSSLLYQRRVWHVTDPLLGVEFSKYDTTVKLYVGWLDNVMSTDRVLPRVHLAEIKTPIALDLSSPLAAVVVSRLLWGLEPHISGVRETIKRYVNAIIGDTQTASSLSWRIDTDLQEENQRSISANDGVRDRIMKWAEWQGYSEFEETMPPRKRTERADIPGSAARIPVSQQPAPMQGSDTKSPLAVSSKEDSLSIPELREPQGYADSIPTFYSRLSCSEFAATNEEEDHRVFRWMFDRQVVPQSIPSDSAFCDEYGKMTGFIWPETWRGREDLPLVDVALEPCVQELLDCVMGLKAQPNAVNCISAKEFPVDLRILEQSFSAILQASRRSREKRGLQENEASWRHDHDRLLFDFFVRLIQQSKGDAALAVADGQSIAHLEDPLARPTLETTLRFPKSDILQSDTRKSLRLPTLRLLSRQPTDLPSWAHTRGDPEFLYVEEARNAAYVTTHWSNWLGTANKEAEASTISKLGYFPSTGRCDALGRLLVELPNVSHDRARKLNVVVRVASKKSTNSKGGERKTSTIKSRAGTLWGSEHLAETSGSSLTVPGPSAGGGTATNGTRYNIPSSSIPSSIPPSGEESAASAKFIDELASKTQRLQIQPDCARLELPLLAVEYKKASEDVMKGTNQIRMYLTASVKFLQAIGITNFPVYGVQTDGPIVVLPAAVLRDDGFVYLFERLVERLDISTPLGAWHYATVLCRLAQNHAKLLENKFEDIRENLIASLAGERSSGEGWTIGDQIARLIAENKAKPSSQRRQKKHIDNEYE